MPSEQQDSDIRYPPGIYIAPEMSPRNRLMHPEKPVPLIPDNSSAPLSVPHWSMHKKTDGLILYGITDLRIHLLNGQHLRSLHQDRIADC